MTLCSAHDTWIDWESEIFIMYFKCCNWRSVRHIVRRCSGRWSSATSLAHDFEDCALDLSPRLNALLLNVFVRPGDLRVPLLSGSRRRFVTHVWLHRRVVAMTLYVTPCAHSINTLFYCARVRGGLREMHNFISYSKNDSRDHICITKWSSVLAALPFVTKILTLFF